MDKLSLQAKGDIHWIGVSVTYKERATIHWHKVQPYSDIVGSIVYAQLNQLSLRWHNYYFPMQNLTGC